MALLVAVASPLAGAEGVELIVAGADSTLIVAGTGLHHIRVKATGGGAGETRLTAELSDPGDDTSLAARGASVLAPQTNSQMADIPINVPALGFYRLKVQVVGANQRVLATMQTTFGAVPPRRSIGPWDFGVCTHFAQNKGIISKSLDLIRLAGFSRIRDEMYWEAIEKKPGEFNFPAQHDNYINAAVGKGLSPLVLLSFGNAKAYPQKYKGSLFPDTDEKRELFTTYAKQCVKRYGDQVKDWEVWNEPQSWGKASPATYEELIKVLYPAIK